MNRPGPTAPRPRQVADRRGRGDRFFDPWSGRSSRPPTSARSRCSSRATCTCSPTRSATCTPTAAGLGLYDGDTRRLSASILRVNGERPVLLQASAGGNYHGAIQLTNPRLERNVADKVRPEDALASQKLGIGRKRVIAGGMLEERVRIVNYAEVDEQVEVTLELAADAADIFEVRGWTRVRARPPAADRHPARPGHVPLRRSRRAADVHARRVRRARGHRRGGRTGRAGSVNAGLGPAHLALAARLGDARELRWLTWSVEERPTAKGVKAGDAAATPTTRCSRPSPCSPSTRSPRRTTRGTAACPRSGPTTSWSTSPSTARPATCGCWSTTARARPSGTWPPACRGSRRCSAATR